MFSQKGSSSLKAIALLLLVAAVGILAYGMGRRRGQYEPQPAVGLPASAETPAPNPAIAEAKAPTVTPAPEVPPPVAAQPPSAPAPPARSEEPPAAESRREDTSTCLTLWATPEHVDAYGAVGPAIQLKVHAQNRCSRSFSGSSVYFRASATGAGGYELASATGRFQGEIPGSGNAETLIALQVDPTRVMVWKVELAQ